MRNRFRVGATLMVVLAASTSAAAATPAATNISGWATVDADGTLHAQQNVVASEQLNTGSYAVRFNSKLNRCGVTATLNIDPEVSGMGEISASISSKDKRYIIIKTADSAGAPSDKPFTVLASC